ncbi:hypothetical protein ABW21_db0200743 [Orbilia brochopaga]|nr:hypothetical protein ABW21_db0200743 [Drechslerella brochopaga]
MMLTAQQPYLHILRIHPSAELQVRGRSVSAMENAVRLSGHDHQRRETSSLDYPGGPAQFQALPASHRPGPGLGSQEGTHASKHPSPPKLVPDAYAITRIFRRQYSCEVTLQRT